MDEDIRALARDLIEHGASHLTPRERRVLAYIASRPQTARNPRAEFEDRMTLGQRAADQIARWGGSWAFVGGFCLSLALWCGWNVLTGRPFDPYPFIFLILSMLAAIRAPVIMMSQNRQAEIDRHTAASDYDASLRAEIEIMELHAKLDGLAARLP